MIALGLCLALCPPARAEKLDEARILGEADARIEKIRKSDATLRLASPDGKPLPAGASVSIEQTRHEFLFGCDIFYLNEDSSPTLNAAYARKFAGLFNYATLPFYWWTYEGRQGKPQENRTQTMIDFCRAHGITPKGHPLVWNYAEPRWLSADPAEVHRSLMERVTREVTRFKGQIQYWDVANELTETTRTECQRNAPNLTRMLTQQGAVNVAAEAFQLTRKTDPLARLIVNDYVFTDAFADRVVKKLNGPDGKPLYDIIGIQSHQHGYGWPTQQVWDACERFAAFGKPIHFTETTVVSGREWPEYWKRKDSEPWPSTPEGERRQAEQVARFYTILFSHPAVEAITWWDLSDRGAWMRAPAGLIRDDMTAKPAYDELLKLVKGKWWTQETKSVGENGSVKLRGFRGNYRVRVKGDDGKTMSGTFTLTRDLSGPVEVKLTATEKRS